VTCGEDIYAVFKPICKALLAINQNG